MNPFIIYALPRSRTAWLASFLSYQKWTCCHDIVIDIHSFAELKQFFSIPFVGSAETGMVEGWKIMQRLVPNARRVVIRRPLKEVKASLAKFGLAADEDLERRYFMLNELSNQPDVLTVEYKDLDLEETCKLIFEHCLGIPFDREWWLALRRANIQIDMPNRLEKIYKNREGISKLKEELARANG